ncbi:MAG: nucleotidyltransferase family protein [Lachnospiraceae bacterium]|nr:nucleotidyltransferase family protein [Lachnospiraceae bacterium]
MKTIGIIMECNPFHKGHEYILNAAKEPFGADHIIVVLSGDHVQRGEPAIMDKYARTACILRAGVDLVLELPVPFATGSAQYFARGAISTLLHTGSVDALLFGSESGDLQVLKSQASNSSALENTSCHDGRHTPMPERLSPNDLLAVEYLKALEHFRSGISALTIPRIGAAYKETDLSHRFASASGLRTLLNDRAKSLAEVASHMPPYAFNLLQSYAEEHRLLSLSDYSNLIFYALLREQLNGYAAYLDLFEDLSQKIRARLNDFVDASSFIALLKSKDITYSHLSRALLHILLGITNEQVSVLTDRYDYCPYLRILGLRKETSLLHTIKQNADRPIITKLADARTLLAPDALALLEQDIFASTLYAKCASKNGGIVSEYRRSPVLM